MAIWGETPVQRRADIVKKFARDPKSRVLIISSVGAVGLNLSCASVVIFTVRNIMEPCGIYGPYCLDRSKLGVLKMNDRYEDECIGHRKKKR